MGRLPGPRSDRAAPASQRLQDRPRLPSPPPTSSQARYPQCPGSAHTRAQSGPTPPPPTWAEPAPRPLISLKQRLLVEAALPGPFQPRACALPPSRAQTPRGQAAPSQSLKQTRSPGALYTQKAARCGRSVVSQVYPLLAAPGEAPSVRLAAVPASQLHGPRVWVSAKENVAV